MSDVVPQMQPVPARAMGSDVARVEAGTECGIGVKNYKDVKAGDLIEVFDRIQVKRTVGDAA